MVIVVNSSLILPTALLCVTVSPIRGGWVTKNNQGPGLFLSATSGSLKESAMTPEAMGTLVKRYFAATRAMDLTAWLACFADDAVSHDPYGGTAMHGKGELTRFFQSVGGAFTEIGFTEDFVAVAGNRVAMKFTSRGIGTNGKSAICEGIDIFEINDRGTIQTMWGYWDPASMIAQSQDEHLKGDCPRQEN